jgi:hypothetical protein
MWEVNSIKELSTQTLSALRALRCDTARDLSKELGDVLTEIDLIDHELKIRKELETVE